MIPALPGLEGSPKLLLVPQGMGTPSLWVQLYERFETRDRLLKWLMVFRQDLAPEARTTERLFVEYADAHPAVVVVSADESDVFGAIWFPGGTPRRAHLSVCYRRGLTPSLTVTCTQAAICLAAGQYGWREVWAETPWLWAKRHAQAVGGSLQATLPDYVLAPGGNRLRPLYILRGYVDHVRDLLRVRSHHGTCLRG